MTEEYKAPDYAEAVEELDEYIVRSGYWEKWVEV